VKFDAVPVLLCRCTFISLGSWAFVQLVWSDFSLTNVRKLQLIWRTCGVDVCLSYFDARLVSPRAVTNKGNWVGRCGRSLGCVLA
jgi:hypothetical protein